MMNCKNKNTGPYASLNIATTWGICSKDHASPFEDFHTTLLFGKSHRLLRYSWKISLQMGSFIAMQSTFASSFLGILSSIHVVRASIHSTLLNRSAVNRIHLPFDQATMHSQVERFRPPALLTKHCMIGVGKWSEITHKYVYEVNPSCLLANWGHLPISLVHFIVIYTC